MVYAFTENFILPLSHDEVVHGKRSLISQMPGDYWQQFANLRLLYGYQYTMPGKKLLFMGGEFGQWTEWNYDSELDWALFGHKYHDALRRYVGDLNRVYRSEPALYEIDFKPEGFRWIQADDYQQQRLRLLPHRQGSESRSWWWLKTSRRCPGKGYRVGVPRAGCYREIINSDAAIYGGGNIGNAGAVYTEPIPAHGHAQSLSLTLPPLGMLMLKPV